MSCTDYDVVVLTETWLNKDILSSELFGSDYVVFRRDRESSRYQRNKDGGGVLIAISKKLNSRRIDKWQSDCEDLWVTINIPSTNKSHEIAICAVYLPPPITLSVIEHYFEHCNIFFETTDIPICIMGDFNLGKIIWDMKNNINDSLPNTSRRLLEFMNINNLIQANNVKNCSGRILDLVLTTMSSCSVLEAVSSLTVIDKLHPPIEISLSLPKECSLPYSSTPRPNFYKAKYNLIISHLEELNWEQQFRGISDVDIMLAIFYEVLFEVIDRYVPMCNPTKSRYPPWFNRSLIQLLKEKNKLRVRYMKYNNPMDKLELQIISKRCKHLTQDLYNGYLVDLEAKIPQNPKLFWSHIKAKRGGSSNYPLTMTDGQCTTSDGDAICDMFAVYFSSVYSPARNNSDFASGSHFLNNMNQHSQCLTYPVISEGELLKKLKSLNTDKGAGPDGIPPIFVSACAAALVTPLLNIYNCSLATGTFPKVWKKAKVVPVYKSGNNDNVTNYRPISILSTFAKIFEAMICPHLQRYFKPYISDHQHGFVANRSTSTNLLSFSETLAQTIDSNEQYDVIYTDLSKAFDKISHSTLISKLSVYGVTGHLLDWFRSYLTDREFYVVINGFRSEGYIITSGAPQGSHLAPTLFNIYINDLPCCFHYANYFLYADDLKIAKKIESPSDTDQLQSDLNRLIEWCSVNNMTLNTKKCYHSTFTRKMQTIGTGYYIEQAKIMEVDTIKDLGVVFDKKMTFIPHIECVTSRASKMLGFVIRNSKGFKKVKTRISLYNMLVKSILEYCSVVWRPHYAVHALRLERIQKRFLWHLAFSTGKTKLLPSYKTRLQHFKILAFSTRLEIADALFVFKLIRGNIDCPGLLSLLRLHAPSRYPRYQITPLCPPLRRSVLGANSPLPRMCRLINSFSDKIDIHHDSYGKYRRTITEHYTSSPS